MDTLLVTLVDRLAAGLQRRGILLPTVQREALSALVACGLLMPLWHLSVRGLDLLGVGLTAMTILLVPAAARRWRAVHAETRAPWSDALAHEYTERANHWRARFIGRYINLFTGVFVSTKVVESYAEGRAGPETLAIVPFCVAAVFETYLRCAYPKSPAMLPGEHLKPDPYRPQPLIPTDSRWRYVPPTDGEEADRLPGTLSEDKRVLINWLQSHGPDDWHQLVFDWNWDGGIEVLAWIAEQPDCDRATAQCLIRRSEPAYYLGFPDREAVRKKARSNVGGFDFLAGLTTRWNEGFYTRSRIESAEPEALQREEQSYREEESLFEPAQLPWRMDAGVFEFLRGRRFRWRYQDGWPPEVEAHLKARRVALDAIALRRPPRSARAPITPPARPASEPSAEAPSPWGKAASPSPWGTSSRASTASYTDAARGQTGSLSDTIIVVDAFDTLFDLHPLRALFHRDGMPHATPSHLYENIHREITLANEMKGFVQWDTLLIIGIRREPGWDTVKRNVENADYEEAMTRLPLAKGAQAFLQAAAGAGIPVHLVAPTGTAALERLVDHAGIRGWLSGVHSVETLRGYAPRRDILGRIANLGGVEAGQMLYLTCLPYDAWMCGESGIAAAWLAPAGPQWMAEATTPTTGRPARLQRCRVGLDAEGSDGAALQAVAAGRPVRHCPGARDRARLIDVPQRQCRSLVLPAYPR